MQRKQTCIKNDRDIVPGAVLVNLSMDTIQETQKILEMNHSIQNIKSQGKGM